MMKRAPIKPTTGNPNHIKTWKCGTSARSLNPSPNQIQIPNSSPSPGPSHKAVKNSSKTLARRNSARTTKSKPSLRMLKKDKAIKKLKNPKWITSTWSNPPMIPNPISVKDIQKRKKSSVKQNQSLKRRKGINLHKKTKSWRDLRWCMKWMITTLMKRRNWRITKNKYRKFYMRIRSSPKSKTIWLKDMSMASTPTTTLKNLPKSQKPFNASGKASKYGLSSSKSYNLWIKKLKWLGKK